MTTPQTPLQKTPLQKTPLQRGWHCVYDLHYHCVFTVKYRRALLQDQVIQELIRISHGIQERYDIQIECLGADQDHVHLLCSAPPKLAPADVVRIYKSVSARELFKALPQLRQELWGGAFWSGGYFACTIGQGRGYAAIKRYVQRLSSVMSSCRGRRLSKQGCDYYLRNRNTTKAQGLAPAVLYTPGTLNGIWYNSIYATTPIDTAKPCPVTSTLSDYYGNRTRQNTP